MYFFCTHVMMHPCSVAYLGALAYLTCRWQREPASIGPALVRLRDSGEKTLKGALKGRCKQAPPAQRDRDVT